MLNDLNLNNDTKETLLKNLRNFVKDIILILITNLCEVVNFPLVQYGKFRGWGSFLRGKFVWSKPLSIKNPETLLIFALSFQLLLILLYPSRLYQEFIPFTCNYKYISNY